MLPNRNARAAVSVFERKRSEAGLLDTFDAGGCVAEDEEFIGEGQRAV